MQSKNSKWKAEVVDLYFWEWVCELVPSVCFQGSETTFHHFLSVMFSTSNNFGTLWKYSSQWENLFFLLTGHAQKNRTSLARTAPWSFTYVSRTDHLFRQTKRQRSWLCIICLFISFVFHIQPDQAIIGEEMLATAALFVKLDSAKNLPVSVQCELSFIWQKGSAKSLLLRIRPQEVWKVTVVKF